MSPNEEKQATMLQENVFITDVCLFSFNKFIRFSRYETDSKEKRRIDVAARITFKL